MPFDAMASAVGSLNANRSLSWEDAIALKQLAPTADEVNAVQALRRELLYHAGPEP